MNLAKLRRILAIDPGDFARILVLGVLAQVLPSRFSGGHSAIWSRAGIPLTYRLDAVVLDPRTGHGMPGQGSFQPGALALNLAIVALLAWGWPWVVSRCLCKRPRVVVIEPLSYALLLAVNLAVILRSWTSSSHGSAPMLDFLYGFPYRQSPLANIPEHWLAALNLLLVIALATLAGLACGWLRRRRATVGAE